MDEYEKKKMIEERHKEVVREMEEYFKNKKQYY